jgi:hypothetical protein
LGNLNDVNNWLGRSNWTGDSNFGGKFNEFRIYDHALAANEIVFNDVVGPDVAQPAGDIFTLEVNTTSGQVTLKNNLAVPMGFNYYEINSAGGALSTTAWSSLDDQEGGDPPGQGWDESGGVDANTLIELFLALEGDTIAADGELNLGNAFNTSVFGAGNEGDLTFQFGLIGGALLTGEVNYVMGPAVLPGDLNGDNAVNFGDLTPFVLALTDIPGYNTMFPTLVDTRVARCDTSGDSQCNFGDLTPFVMILQGGPSSGTAVPEPATASMAVCLALAALLKRRQPLAKTLAERA